MVTPKVNVFGSTPYDYFSKLFPDELLNHIITETTRYAVQLGKDNLQITKEELQIYLGINIIMTYIKYPQTRMYWSSITGLGLPLISEHMGVNKFGTIKRFIHFCNNDQENELRTGDKFWKIDL